MAGVLCQGLMDSVLAKLNDLVGDTCAKLIGVSRDIRFLREELLSMNALLKKLEDNEQLDPQVQNWRYQVLEMIYDIEDCIDDFKNNVTSLDAKASLINKVSSFVRTLRAHFDTAQQIKELKARMQDINDRRKRYKVDDCTFSTSITGTVDPRLPALYNEADILVGINNPKEQLINWLLDEDQRLKVVSIVGTGGLGKTTLANEVYRVVTGQEVLGETTHATRFFTGKAFVSISRAPDWIWILTNMLSQLKENPTSGAYDLQSIVGSLRQYLHDKRYLIIVDDLWTVPDWNNIIRCTFPQNNRQSRVIVTTRDVEVARACCSGHQYIYYMQPLSDTDSRTLFLKRMSISEDSSHFQNSEAVLSEILKKCGGLPLAIITIASILACQEPGRIKENWECIQNSLAIQSAANLTLEVMVQILDLSYRSLPHYLKPCFLYLGKYPEDHTISKVNLVRQWVAEGFVSSHSDRDVWDIAEGYFNEFINRCMIQPVYHPRDNTLVVSCRVHDMMLDLILRRCGEDNFITMVRDLQKVEEGKYRVRRLSMDMSGKEDVTRTRTATALLSQVRSLSMFGGNDWIPPLLEFKFIRVLFLEFSKNVKRMDLMCIIQLSQLRYLKINHGRRRSPPDLNIVLPNKIQRLQRLETLEISASINDLNIPSDMVDLPRLCHLTVPLDTKLPDGIGKVSSLRTLDGFNLSKSSIENIRALGALTNLLDLVLSFSTQTDSETMLTKTGALSSAMETLSRLKRICILQIGICYGDSLVSLPFPHLSNLERLDMLCLRFPRIPRWISGLRKLRIMELAVDEISDDDGIIGTLPSLVFLHLRILEAAAERIVIATGFPALKTFTLDYNGISRISFESGAMPDLQVLDLVFRPRTWNKSAPAGLQHLTSLKKIYSATILRMSADEASPEEVEAMNVLIMGVFKKAIDALPTRPTFSFHPNRFINMPR